MATVNPSTLIPPKTLLTEVIQIRKNVLGIRKLIRLDSSLLKKSEERQRKEREQKKFQEKELKSEEKKNKLIPDFKPTEFPKMGFLDRIKQFLFYTVLGAAFTKFGKHIPKVLGLLKNLKPAFEFFENLTGNILNGLVDFVGFGYKAYDKVKEIIVGISGDNTEKSLQEFDKKFNTFANLAIIAGMTAAGSVDFDGGGGKRERLGVDKQTGQRVGKRAQARYLNRYGEDAYIKKFGKRSFKGLTGKAPSRFAGRLAGKTLGKVPIIGGLVDFIISTVIFKEKPGRAAAKAVGATIGSALGTFVPVPFAGTILGGILGDLVGGALYDSLVGGDKIQGKARGGQVTRGGKSVSAPIRRTVKRTRTKPPRIKPRRTIPGKDIGGRKEIEKIFPSPKDPRQKNPLGLLETASNNVKKLPLIGGVSSIGLDQAMGQRTDSSVFKGFGLGLGYLIQNAIDSETNGTISSIQNQIVGLAGGGAVPRTLSTNENIGMKIGERIGKTLEAMVNSQVNNTLQSIRQQLTKKDIVGGGGGAPDGGGGGAGGGGGGMLPGDAPPEVKAALEAIAGAEGGWDSVNPGKVVPGLRNMTIAQAREVGMDQRSIAGSGALGKFQQLPVYNGVNVLKQRAEAAGLNYERDKFNEENQTKIARAYIAGVYPGGELQLIKDARKDPMILANKLKGIYPSLPGGSQPNVHTSGYLDRYQQALEKYKVSQPLSTKGVKKFSRSDITSHFGQQESFRKKPHEGMDIAARQGTPISFGLGGEIIGIWRTNSGARNANGGYGTFMDIKFSDGRIARMAHLSSIPSNLKKGSKFKANEIIAYSGGEEGKPGSGRSGGPHIHLEQLSKPMGIEETTKGKYDPLRGGIFDLIQSGGTSSTKLSTLSRTPQASLAPKPTSNIAYGLDRQGAYVDSSTTLVAIQPMEIIKTVPFPIGGGSVNNIASNQSLNQTQAALANA